jgi:hypothetical protein
VEITMSAHVAVPLPKKRWAYLKALQPSRGRYLHISARICRNPLAAKAELAKKPFYGPHFVAEKGTTYNIGRNKAKREALKKPWGRSCVS